MRVEPEEIIKEMDIINFEETGDVFKAIRELRDTYTDSHVCLRKEIKSAKDMLTKQAVALDQIKSKTTTTDNFLRNIHESINGLRKDIQNNIELKTNIEKILNSVAAKVNNMNARFEAEKPRQFSELNAKDHNGIKIWCIQRYGDMRGALTPMTPVFKIGRLAGLSPLYERDKYVQEASKFTGFFFTNPFVELP
jgi:hypothetical protein